MAKVSTEQKSIVPHLGAWDDIVDFALMFDGYLWAKSAGKDLGRLANDCQEYFRDNGCLPVLAMSELRASLFFFHRAHRHGGTDIEDYPEEVKYNDALLEAIRDKLRQTGGDIYTREGFKELLLSWNNHYIGIGQTIRIVPKGGRVVEDGPRNSNRAFSVSQDQFESLLSCLEKMDFLNLEPAYVSGACDVGVHLLSLEIDGVCHWVEYDHGVVDDPQGADCPKGLFELEKIIEHIAEVTDETR